MARTQNGSSSLDAKAIRWIRLRVLMLAFAFVPLFGALIYRAVTLQIVEGPRLTGLAKDQYMRQVTLPGRRGEVFDRGGTALAASVDVDSIYVDPSELEDVTAAARQLARAVGAEPQKMVATLNGARRFAWVKRRATPQEVAAVKALKLPGIGFTKEPRRFYPQRELAAHVLGFSGMDGEGLEGVELAFDAMLRGKPQAIAGLRDARGRSAILEGTVPAEELRGASVTLTLDRTIQYQTEKVLAAAVAKANAAAGVAVVLDPNTGGILALANVPTFNPNEPSRSSRPALRNRALADQFEPGSTFKVFTVAAALEEKAIRAKDTFFCENGAYRIGRHTIHDHGGYGQLDVGSVLQVSSNICSAKIAEKLGRDRLQAYLRAFGFGEKPGSGLVGEARGQVPFPRADVALATQSFGQGVTASALQIAAAMGAIANGGALMRPYLVSRVVDPEGVVLVDRKPELVRQVVSPATAKEVLRMMKLVVEKEGTAPLARMDEYEVAGKTGTAQKADSATGRYSVDKRTASFVGIVPANAPRLVVLVVIDEPRGDVYGGLVAAPAFKEISRVALAHLGVPPSPGREPKKIAAAEPAGPALDDADRARLSGAFALATAPKAESPGEGFIEDEGVAAGDESAVVPNVQGLTARLAVKALAAANLEPALQGSGRAIGQAPAPGATVRRGTRVSVRLQSKL